MDSGRQGRGFAMVSGWEVRAVGNEYDYFDLKRAPASKFAPTESPFRGLCYTANAKLLAIFEELNQ